jgi:uncharacterized protein
LLTAASHLENTFVIQKIHELHPRQFAEALSAVVSHSRPIETKTHLKGREEQLRGLTQAIFSPGRHAFVYGERGVGKTSLAKTAGISSATNIKCFKQVGCSKDITFHELMRLIIEVFDPKKLASLQKQSSWSLGSLVGFSSNQGETYTPTERISVSGAADVLASLDDDGTNELRVVVIDEVERLGLSDVRGQFAELVKLLGDRGARITLIFTGVGTDLESILGSHASAFRQIAQIPLNRIDYQSALDIIDDALEKFGLDWEVEPTRTARFRIANIANGFPYYIHLLVEKLLYQVYEDKTCTNITLEHLQLAVSAAVKDAQEEIRKPYDNATRGRNITYRYATWAAADSWTLERTAAQIHGSYVGICQRLDVPPIDNTKFLQILAALKREKYGPILKAGFRKGLYEFTENIGRGYVRLCAAAEGVDLNDLGPDPAPTITARVRDKRYIDPRKLGGAPSTFSR